ncbi:MAG: AtpZ/AtpI family protein [Oscillospiraceae bacterium]|nr:AtpZ/AtpI family protein [Oscillospiraceae bacterium]MCL2279333.1 AtpZ/AtpI family protein [Oscillospiraceae bacterium]
MQNHKKTDTNEFSRAFAMLSQIGISIVVCIGVGIGLGWFLDRILGTSPWLLLVFTIFGIVAAFKAILEFAKKV